MTEGNYSNVGHRTRATYLGWILKFNLEILVRGVIDVAAVVRITIFVIAVYISSFVNVYISTI
jgi:hypothetical protein